MLENVIIKTITDKQLGGFIMIFDKVLFSSGESRLVFIGDDLSTVLKYPINKLGILKNENEVYLTDIKASYYLAKAKMCDGYVEQEMVYVKDIYVDNFKVKELIFEQHLAKFLSEYREFSLYQSKHTGSIKSKLKCLDYGITKGSLAEKELSLALSSNNSDLLVKLLNCSKFMSENNISTYEMIESTPELFELSYVELYKFYPDLSPSELSDKVEVLIYNKK